MHVCALVVVLVCVLVVVLVCGLVGVCCCAAVAGRLPLWGVLRPSGCWVLASVVGICHSDISQGGVMSFGICHLDTSQGGGMSLRWDSHVIVLCGFDFVFGHDCACLVSFELMCVTMG